MTAQHRADVAIVGAGAAGAALAIRLAAMGARVVLVDARPAQSALWPDTPGERLPPQTRFALQDLGLAFEDWTVPEAGLVVHWSGPAPQIIGSGSAPALLCWRGALNAALLARAVDLGVSVLSGHRFCALMGQPGRWRMQVQSTDAVRIEAGLVVDASGRRAVLAQALGQGPIRRDDAMIGLLRWWQGAPLHRPVFHLEAIAGGWWYATALPGGRGVAGFITPRGLLRDRPLPAWHEAQRRAPLIRQALPCGAVWGPVASFAAGPGLADRLAGPGWLRLGDAAAQGDPIEGRGVLRALLSAQNAARLISSDPARQAEARQHHEADMTSWHTDHLIHRRQVYADSDRLGPAFQAALAVKARGGIRNQG